MAQWYYADSMWLALIAQHFISPRAVATGLLPGDLHIRFLCLCQLCLHLNHNTTCQQDIRFDTPPPSAQLNSAIEVLETRLGLPH